jgi:hypothetical protein
MNSSTVWHPVNNTSNHNHTDNLQFHAYLLDSTNLLGIFIMISSRGGGEVGGVETQESLRNK